MDTTSHLTSLSPLLRSLLPVVRWPALASVIALVAGCAFAPGMSFDETAPDDDARTSATAMDAPADAAPAGALQKITPDLIRKQRAAQATDVGADVKRLYGVPKPYRIGSGDILNIVVWDHPDLVLAPAGSLTTDATSGSPVSNGYNVSADGLIQFPYVGSFKVGGLTEYEVRDRLTKALAKYFEEPKLTVRIQSYRSGRVYVDGEVRHHCEEYLEERINEDLFLAVLIWFRYFHQACDGLPYLFPLLEAIPADVVERELTARSDRARVGSHGYA